MPEPKAATLTTSLPASVSFFSQLNSPACRSCSVESARSNPPGSTHSSIVSPVPSNSERHEHTRRRLLVRYVAQLHQFRTRRSSGGRRRKVRWLMDENMPFIGAYLTGEPLQAYFLPDVIERLRLPHTPYPYGPA